MSGILASTVGGGISDLVINITNTVNPNIPALVTAAGWLGTMQKIRIVSTGLVNTLSIPASLDGADITLDFTSASFVGGTYNGGTAIKTRAHIKARNLGTLAGGGGAGGNGALAWLQRMANGHQQSLECYGGAGGRGQGFAAGSLTVLSAQSGGPGEYKKLSATGSFGGGGGRGIAELWAGGGGAGGGWGSGGGGSNFASVSGDFDSWSGGGINPGGAAGKAVDGDSYITWISTGTRLGGIA